METMERDAEYIASQCKYIRKIFSLTQENLADVSGLTVRTIQKVESGRHVPEVQTCDEHSPGEEQSSPSCLFCCCCAPDPDGAAGAEGDAPDVGWWLSATMSGVSMQLCWPLQSGESSP